MYLQYRKDNLSIEERCASDGKHTENTKLARNSALS